MNAHIHNTTLAPSVWSNLEENGDCLSTWLDGQLAMLEEKHSGFVTRDSLARHFGGEDSRRGQD